MVQVWAGLIALRQVAPTDGPWTTGARHPASDGFGVHLTGPLEPNEAVPHQAGLRVGEP